MSAYHTRGVDICQNIFSVCICRANGLMLNASYAKQRYFDLDKSSICIIFKKRNGRDETFVNHITDTARKYKVKGSVVSEP